MSLVVPFDDIFADKAGLLANHSSWQRVELGSVCKILNGFAFKSSLFNREHGFPIIRIRDLSKGVAETLYKGDFPSEYVVDNGDLLIGMDGNFCCWEWCGGKAGLNQRVCKIIANEEFISRKFVLYGINGYLQAIQDVTSSVTVGHLSSLDVLKIPFPLPPLNEQRRIVAKLDELLSRVDACQQRLARIPVILKRFRQAVLAAACSGRLTADWRELNNLDDWEWSILSQQDISIQTGPFGSALHKHDYVSNGIPLVNPMHIREGQIYPNANQSVSKNKLKELTRYVLGPGDIVLGRRGEMGRAAVVRSKGLLCGTGSLFLRTTSDKVVPDFLCLLLRSPQTCAFLEEGSVGSTMTNLNQQIVGSLGFPITSPDEQQEIVRRVEALFKLADQLETRYTAAQAQVDKLTQSILAKAFRGELVPQDPSDEPAEKLLERIREQRETAATQPRNKKASPGPVVQHVPTVEPHTAAAPDLSKTARKILRHMKKGHSYAKHELTTAAILSTSEWNSAIRELKEAGLVHQTGDKRGASYSKP